MDPPSNPESQPSDPSEDAQMSPTLTTGSLDDSEVPLAASPTENNAFIFGTARNGRTTRSPSVPAFPQPSITSEADAFVKKLFSSSSVPAQKQAAAPSFAPSVGSAPTTSIFMFGSSPQAIAQKRAVTPSSSNDPGRTTGSLVFASPSSIAAQRHAPNLFSFDVPRSSASFLQCSAGPSVHRAQQAAAPSSSSSSLFQFGRQEPASVEQQATASFLFGHSTSATSPLMSGVQTGSIFGPSTVPSSTATDKSETVPSLKFTFSVVQPEGGSRATTSTSMRPIREAIASAPTPTAMQMQGHKSPTASNGSGGTSSDDPSASVIKSPRFYLDDGTIILKIKGSSPEGTQDTCEILYKVHRFFLERDSVVFRSMLSFPPGEQGMKGTSDDTAILLSEVTQSELDALLSFFYNGMYQPEIDIPELKALLSISSRYVFEQIRQRAVEMLDNHDPPLSAAEQVALASKYDIKQWLKPAYVTLGKRKQPISDEEAAEMGFEAAVRIGRVRETLLKRRRGDLSHVSWLDLDPLHKEVRALIEAEFKLPPDVSTDSATSAETRSTLATAPSSAEARFAFGNAPGTLYTIGDAPSSAGMHTFANRFSLAGLLDTMGNGPSSAEMPATASSSELTRQKTFTKEAPRP